MSSENGGWVGGRDEGGREEGWVSVGKVYETAMNGGSPPREPAEKGGEGHEGGGGRGDADKDILKLGHARGERERAGSGKTVGESRVGEEGLPFCCDEGLIRLGVAGSDPASGVGQPSESPPPPKAGPPPSCITSARARTNSSSRGTPPSEIGGGG